MTGMGTDGHTMRGMDGYDRDGQWARMGTQQEGWNDRDGQWGMTTTTGHRPSDGTDRASTIIDQMGPTINDKNNQQQQQSTMNNYLQANL